MRFKIATPCSLARRLVAVAMVVLSLVAGSASAEERTLVFDLGTVSHGWVAGFADYPRGKAYDWNLTFGYERLPPELGLAQNAVYLSGDNHSDDLFMFVKRRITGLAPDTTYDLIIDVVFATTAPRGCSGIGGAPGESVYLKAGATAVEPRAILGRGFHEMNIDKGSQSQGGRDAAVLGHIAKTSANCKNARYELKTLGSKPRRMHATTDSAGELWLLVGTDSGYEGTTRIYLKQVSVTLR
jgi:hypothetical protein